MAGGRERTNILHTNYGKSLSYTTKVLFLFPEYDLLLQCLVKMPNLIKNELAIELFWIISKVFSEYIANDTKTFKMFVANRAQVIQENNGANE